jgi:hypothetical protein
MPTIFLRSRRRRRPPQRHPSRHTSTPYADRDAAAVSSAMKRPSPPPPCYGAQQPAARLSGGPALLHRRPPRRSRTAPRTQAVAELDDRPYLPGLTTGPLADPAAHLLSWRRRPEHPLRHVQTAASGRTSAVPATWPRPLAPPAHATDPGPLPWLPGIPPTLHDHPVWGPTWQSDQAGRRPRRPGPDRLQGDRANLDTGKPRAPPSSAKSQRAANGINLRPATNRRNQPKRSWPSGTTPRQHIACHHTPQSESDNRRSTHRTSATTRLRPHQTSGPNGPAAPGR